MNEELEPVRLYKFEYQTQEHYDYYSIQTWIEGQGQEGWRLVQVVFQPPSVVDSNQKWVAFMERAVV
jgi:hypothetical protein